MKKRLAMSSALAAVSDEIEQESAIISSSQIKKESDAFYGLIVHTEATEEWAQKIKQTILSYEDVVFPENSFLLSLTEISKNEFVAYNDLLSHPTFFSQIRKPAFIVTPGRWETDIVHNALSLTSNPPAHFCCMHGKNVKDHTEGAPISGVLLEPARTSEYLDALQGLKPDIKNICLVKEHSFGLLSHQKTVEKQVNNIKKTFNTKGINTIEHTWCTNNAELSSLESKIDYYNIEAIVISEGASVQFHREKIIDLCNRKKVILFASELDTVAKGAALGCGVFQNSFALPLTKMITEQFLIQPQKKLPDPYLIPEQPGIKYNMKALTNQGVSLSPEQSSLVRMQSVFDVDIIKWG